MAIAVLIAPVVCALLLGYRISFGVRSGPVAMSAPIQIALLDDASLDAVRRIIDQNPRSVDMVDDVRGTAMDCALTCDRADVVELLLEAGWDPNRDVVALNMRPGNPLGYAVATGQWEIAQTLLDYGADPKKATWDGLSGRELSLQYEEREKREMSQRMLEGKPATDPVSDGK
jgi:ankyrin repeat protein